MIREAVATVEMVPSCAVFVRGSLEPHWATIGQMWRFLLRLSPQPARYRRGASAQWKAMPEAQDEADALFDAIGTGVGCRWFEAAPDEGRDGLRLEITDLMPVGSNQRASEIRVRFPKDITPAQIVRFAEWAIQNLPLWWGTAGLVFEHLSGPRLIAYKRIAALAKRHWGIQILDRSTLQWDALEGMPGINWLTLVGNEFAKSAGMDVNRIMSEAAGLVSESVYHRKGAQGVVLAAGAQPIKGDINNGEDLIAYVRVAALLEPLLLAQHTSLVGPFSMPDVLTAWLSRFSNPRSWLDSDIADD
jgi:hypothetical protein